MKRTRLILLACSMIMSLSTYAQGQNKQSFADYRKALLDRYQDYRKSVLENYAKYLDGIWDNYNKFKGEDPDSVPKPSAAPIVFEDNGYDKPSILPEPKVQPEPEAIPESKPKPKAKPTREPEVIAKPEPVPEPAPAPKAEPEPEAVPAPKAEPEPEAAPVPKAEPEAAPVPKPEPEAAPAPKAEPEAAPVPKAEPEAAPQPKAEPVAEPVPVPVAEPVVVPTPTPTPTPAPVAEPTPAPVPEPAAEPAAEPSSSAKKKKGTQFDFYGMMIDVPEPTFRIKEVLESPTDYSYQWTKLAKGGDAAKMADKLSEIAEGMGLNDYLTFEMVRSWAKGLFGNVDATSRTSLAHFMLANMGFDVRISVTGSGLPVLLVPFKQMMYSRPYLKIENKKYYIFPENEEDSKNMDMRLSTCRLPKDVDLGRIMDLEIHDLNIPYKAKPFVVEFGDMKIEGEVNANLEPVLKHYPHTDMRHYSRSEICPELRQSVVSQVKEQLGGMEQTAAVNKLLRFVQKGFKYATDHAYHGYEKPYFFEEMFIYDKCDCEDRAIFYTYLLWNVLGVRNHMVNFPGHESVGVHVNEDLAGTRYVHDGETYYISDPTYIGSHTGMCMPKYKDTPPRIDHEYK